MSELLKVSSNPHIRSKSTTGGIMAAVIVGLLPAAGFGIYNFGFRAMVVILVTIASTVLTEFLFGLYKKKAYYYRFVGGGDRTSSGAQSAGEYSAVDSGAWRRICHFGG